jgi:hypothetical protein
MNALILPPPLYAFWTVGTSSGLRLTVWARSADEARAKVHGAVCAWRGLEPLAGNDNRRAQP